VERCAAGRRIFTAAGSSRRRPVPELNFTDDVLAVLAERTIESTSGGAA
jgi:hypothetical protein